MDWMALILFLGFFGVLGYSIFWIWTTLERKEICEVTRVAWNPSLPEKITVYFCKSIMWSVYLTAGGLFLYWAYYSQLVKDFLVGVVAVIGMAFYWVGGLIGAAFSSLTFVIVICTLAIISAINNNKN